MNRVNPVGWFLVLFFLIGGIAFWITIPDIFIGQIWVVVALGLAALYFFIGRRGAAQEKIKREGIPAQAQILSAEQTGMYVNEQPQVKLHLRIEGQGVEPYEVQKRVVVPFIALGTLSSGRPLSVYIDREDRDNVVIDWGGSGAAPATISHEGGPPVDLNANPAARQAVMQVLEKHGINPTGAVDLRQNPAVRAAVLEALNQHGVDVAHGVAAAAPSAVESPKAEEETPLNRLQKLMELKNAQLISDEEFAEQRQKIIGEV
jgi:hypothetical protein